MTENTDTDQFQVEIEKLLTERFPKSATGFLAGADFKSAGMDSIGVVEFVVLLERHFGLPALDGDELTGTSTLSDVRDLVTSKRDA
ncbi:acyl carrier protein [Streptomyces violascens]|uniref:acyl carrier protein n=1 Tax=Streptomyces violascens TaxID=67381 RepID=UPI00364F1D4F